MLIAAAVGDAKRFDSIWGWTKDNLQRPDGLHLLPLARRQGGGPPGGNRRRRGRRRALLVALLPLQPARPAAGGARPRRRRSWTRRRPPFQGAPVLTAGPWARKHADHGQPQLLLARHVRGAGRRDGRRPLGQPVGQLAHRHRLLMPAPGRLPPDWARLEGDKPVPIGSPSHRRARRSSASTPCARSCGWPRIRTRPAGGSPPGHGPSSTARSPPSIPVEHDLTGKPTGNTLHPVALVAAAGAADAAGQTAARDGLLDAAEALDQRAPTYYGAAWVALGRIMLTTNALDSCS